jgi:hypothetical protein
MVVNIPGRHVQSRWRGWARSTTTASIRALEDFARRSAHRNVAVHSRFFKPSHVHRHLGVPQRKVARCHLPHGRSTRRSKLGARQRGVIHISDRVALDVVVVPVRVRTRLEANRGVRVATINDLRLLHRKQKRTIVLRDHERRHRGYNRRQQLTDTPTVRQEWINNQESTVQGSTETTGNPYTLPSPRVERDCLVIFAGGSRSFTDTGAHLRGSQPRVHICDGSMLTRVLREKKIAYPENGRKRPIREESRLTARASSRACSSCSASAW